MLKKTQIKMLKEFPWLWAIHSLWTTGVYDHIFVERALAGAFTTVINKNYDVKIWVKLTSFGDTQWVEKLHTEHGKTVAQIIANITGIFSDKVTLDYIALENKSTKVLTIYKQPKNCEFKNIFAPFKSN